MTDTDPQKLLALINRAKDSREVWHHSLAEAEQALENAARQLAARVFELQAENERLRTALDYYAKDHPRANEGPWGVDSQNFGRVARAALKGGEKI